MEKFLEIIRQIGLFFKEKMKNKVFRTVFIVLVAILALKVFVKVFIPLLVITGISLAAYYGHKYFKRD